MVPDDICEELVLHYVPAHVGLIGNELADQWAKRLFCLEASYLSVETSGSAETQEQYEMEVIGY
eukprot:584781-Ditylum_brightwellii.AAC.1